LIGLGYWGAKDIQVGDAVPGSSLFWPWHRYNRDGFRITFSMPILSPLYVLMEGEKQYDLVSCPGKRELCGENFAEMYRFEKFMRETPGRRVMFVDSIIKTIPGTHWLMHEGDPNWYFFPENDREINHMYRRATISGRPGSEDRYVDAGEDTAANIIIYCRDKMTPTIKTVMTRVKDYIENHSKLQLPMRYKLAGGAFGVQAAVNEVIEEYHFRTLGWALLAIFLICWIMFRSIAAAFILTIPLIVSNLIAFSMMATGMFYTLPTPITITTSTLPVSAVGIGLGVDYGIYMLGRILEEYKISQNLKDSIHTTMTSVGEPVVFTALAMTGGLIVWIFSPLMFQATMGFFLATILLLNMLGGLLLVPSFVAVIKPKFVVG
jgi:predicted RND superfamily exporter protein